MNKAIIAGLAAGVLVVGLIMSPLFMGISPLSTAQAQGTGVTKHVTLIAGEKVLQVAPDNAIHPGGVKYNAMVFNGTIPGPVIAVDQGDTLQITLKNEGKVIHSIDFHAGLGPSNAIGAKSSDHGANLQPGESRTWELHAVNAGFFLYHCGADGLNGIWEHIASGMYGGIVVHPANEKPAKEFYVSFGEIYGDKIGAPFTPVNGTASFDLVKLWSDQPDLVMTNGESFKYVPAIGSYNKLTLNANATLFKVKPGEQTRWYILNPGPNDGVSFHFISSQIDVRDGSIVNRYGTQDKNDETWWITAASGSVIEATFPEEGVYVGVDHAMKDVLKGAAFAVLATNDSTPNDHPEGTWVPPLGSDMVSGPSMMNGSMMG
jgi:nitrite reductase (NO-forming)